ncbi:DUF2848 domain-containing protein [Thalassobius sp. I31.1]|uniref:DUF2848 domain-containing protein n=1 Tax=Thalassobius sp. I31.1 TaxID=2109912 RepID=UPI000D1BB839|nr:DUF2848 domain-containing protein [Thalassobius sp. I31.1]
MNLAFNLNDTDVSLSITSVIVAGWTGRNADAVQHHIDELAAIGIAPPSKVPLFYRVSDGLLTQTREIEVLGEATSGEVEPLLIRSNGKTYFGLASDHTDRDLEAHSVAASKQACAKPVASELWNYDSIKDHLDDIKLSCWMEIDDTEVLYQEGTLASIRPLAELCDDAGFGEGSAMLCGTLGAIGGVRPANKYRMTVTDPVLSKTMQLSYSVSTLPIVS